MDVEPIRFVVTPDRGEVGGLLALPSGARAVLVLAHGAGAGMDHPFLASLAAALARHRMATLRYQFPYTEAGRRRPDPPPVLEATVRAAVAEAARRLPDLPRFAGGKSMGGRMTSRAAAASALDVRGLVMVGFPLHAAGGPPNVERAAHLAAVPHPMLFLQGTRDALADASLMRAVCHGLGARATLHEVDGADHGFHVLKRSGRDDAAVREELAAVAAAWMGSRVSGP